MELISINSTSKSKIKQERKYLPLEIRMKMYNDVIELRKQGLTHRQIQKRIYEEYGMQLPQSTISYWINRKCHPLRRINKFNDKPSTELAYVIGTILSDGSKYFDGKNYHIVLSVNDKEFAEEFGKCLAKVLGRNEPYNHFGVKKKKSG